MKYKSILEEIINKIFPADSIITWDAAAVSQQNRFWVIGSEEEPRWIIPQNPKLGLPFLLQWRPYSTLSYIKWKTIRRAYRTGTLKWFPKIFSIGISNSKTDNWEHLGWIDRQSLTPSIYIGTPSSTRKAVAAFASEDSDQLIGIAKIPLEKNSGDKILHEAKTLVRLTREKPGIGPSPLFVSTPQEIAVQTVLEGYPIERCLTPSHLKLLSKLHIPDADTCLSEQTELLSQHLFDNNIMEDKAKAFIYKLLNILNDTTPLPATWVHGDFAPWNLKCIGSKKLAAVDWEETIFYGLPLQDLFHYFYVQSFLFKTNQNLLEKIRKNDLVSEYLSCLGIDRLRYEKLCLFYLVQTWVNHLEGGNSGYASFILDKIKLLLEQLK